jgi:hypothetical protein
LDHPKRPFAQPQTASFAYLAVSLRHFVAVLFALVLPSALIVVLDRRLRGS